MLSLRIVFLNNNNNNGIEKFEEVYIIPGIENLFLSCNLCKSLKLIHEQFPIVNVDKLTSNSTPINKENVADNNKKRLPQEAPALHNRPSSLPYPTTEENIPCLKEYLLNAFADTTFNTNARPLPAMKCKDFEIHLVQPNVPHHANIPLPVPNHLRDAVKKQLDDDVARGVLRKVPLGEATDWCHHMVVQIKNDHDPRRVVDFQPLNKYSKREVHYTEPPFSAVSTIPHHTYKSSFDAFNGYHQVRLAPDSIPLTTFITPWGRYQYLRTPQGHCSSGDGYTRRYDDIIVDVERKRKIIDDVCLYDSSIKEAFYCAFDFLLLSGKNGITQNPEKFQFCQKELEFAGFIN